jgi:hypothetical protein
MPPRKPRSKASVTDYRHAEKRKNIPPAGLEAQGKVQERRIRYFYDPHLPPVLRFDGCGGGGPPARPAGRDRTATALSAEEVKAAGGSLAPA